MRRATVRAAQAGLSLALLLALTPLSAAYAQTDPSSPTASIEEQGTTEAGQAPATGGGQNATTSGQTAGGGQATGAGQAPATGGQSATGSGQTAGGGQAAPAGGQATGGTGTAAAPGGAQTGAAPAAAPGGAQTGAGTAAAPSGGQAGPAAAPAPAGQAAASGQPTAPGGGQAGPVQTGVAGQVPAGGGPSQAVPTGTARQAPAIVYGFFRDPLWPGPGQRFIAADCPIGLGATIIHYCPSLPPLAEAVTAPEPLLPAAVLQCNPWFQYFPTCRRAMDPAP
jgi:hypothetical protein